MDINNLQWTNKPKNFTIEPDRISITTEPHTDLWQRTYYHFCNDNAPILQTRTDRRYFTFIIKTEFQYRQRFDQCGVIIYLDSQNWLKASIEYDKPIQHIGSVLTTTGYSDWATAEIEPSINFVWYRLSRREDDFRLEYSLNGDHFQQMRICHMQKADGAINFGVYACSPENSSFTAVFSHLQIIDCVWDTHDGQKPDW